MFTADGVNNAGAAVGLAVRGNVPRVAFDLGQIWLALEQVCQGGRRGGSTGCQPIQHPHRGNADRQGGFATENFDAVLVRIRQPREDAGTAILKVCQRQRLAAVHIGGQVAAGAAPRARDRHQHQCHAGARWTRRR